MHISGWLTCGKKNARVRSAHDMRNIITIKTTTMMNVATNPQKAGTR
jgi:hypothetical protein